MDIATDSMAFAVRTARMEQDADDSADLILGEEAIRVTDSVDVALIGLVLEKHYVTRSMPWIGGRQCHWNEKDS